MLIKNLFKEQKPVISFEIFPPNRQSKLKSIYQTIDALAGLNPDYISVTYGASGSHDSKNTTIELASFIKREYQIEALAHLTCITATRDVIRQRLDQLEANQIENILALRGDLPANPDFEFPNPLHFQHASDLIRFIRSEKSFSIGAACHPEGHVEAKSKTMDLIHLKHKVEQGADFLVSQLFFDNTDFYSFVREVRNLGIDIPVIAGIMPVVNKRQIERIVKLCGARVPLKFQRILERYAHQPEALLEAGIAYASEQIIDLLSAGVEGIHIYAMNRPDIAKRLYHNINPVVRALSDQRKDLYVAG